MEKKDFNVLIAHKVNITVLVSYCECIGADNFCDKISDDLHSKNYLHSNSELPFNRIKRLKKLSFCFKKKDRFSVTGSDP